MIDFKETVRRLIDHLTVLTVTIGERAMFSPDKLEAAAHYIESAYRLSGLDVEREDYPCTGYTATNVVAFSDPSGGAAAGHYLVGAHYDSVLGTVGADDNASAVAVQLEVARQLHAMRAARDIPVSVKFVSFALEEHPAYATRFMGSRVHAKGMKARREKLDGMICLEMVGYTCDRPGCQKYPFPLGRMNYPKRGDYIGIVGNLKSRKLVRGLYESFGKNPALPVVSLTVPLNGWILPAVRLSDHASFWNERFPAVMVTDSAFFRNPNYHLPSDTMNTLDFEFMARLVQSLLIFFNSFATT
ncbi:MAG: M28 family peptidase [Syntrophobacteraceae bacterium]